MILFVEERARMNGGLSMPSITTSSWLSASPPPPPEHPPGIAARAIRVELPNDGGYVDAARRALLEQPLAPGARLDDQVAARVDRAEGPKKQKS